MIHNVAQFKKDCSKFVHDYRSTGPMVPGLDPRDASDRLIIAQVSHKLSFAKLWVLGAHVLIHLIDLLRKFYDAEHNEWVGNLNLVYFVEGFLFN